MSDAPDAQGARTLLRWGGAIATLLFAAASIAYVLEGASIGPIMINAALAVGFGRFTRREWRRAR